MSRSYKKHPVIKYAGNKDYKKLFNRRLRRTAGIDDIPNGNAYKKMNESWEINDICSRCDWPQYRDIDWYWDNFYGFPRKTEEELYRDWYKCYKGK